MPTRKQNNQYNKTKHIRGGNDERKKCSDTFCSEKKFEKIQNMIIVNLDKKMKELEKKLEKKDITVEEKKKLEEDINARKGFIKNLNNIKSKEKSIKKLKDGCELIYCNKGCLGTIFEEGDPNKLPSELTKRFKGNKPFLDLILQTRKELFGKKTRVLQEDFYEKLNKKTVNKTKKKGAISGCVKFIMDDS